KDAILPDNWRGIARPLQRDFPANVLADGPFDWQVGLPAMTVHVRPAPSRPVVGGGSAGDEHGQQCPMDAANDHTAPLASERRAAALRSMHTIAMQLQNDRTGDPA